MISQLKVANLTLMHTDTFLLLWVSFTLCFDHLWNSSILVSYSQSHRGIEENRYFKDIHNDSANASFIINSLSSKTSVSVTNVGNSSVADVKSMQDVGKESKKNIENAYTGHNTMTDSNVNGLQVLNDKKDFKILHMTNVNHTSVDQYQQSEVVTNGKIQKSPKFAPHIINDKSLTDKSYLNDNSNMTLISSINSSEIFDSGNMTVIDGSLDPSTQEYRIHNSEISSSSFFDFHQQPNVSFGEHHSYWDNLLNSASHKSVTLLKVAAVCSAIGMQVTPIRTIALISRARSTGDLDGLPYIMLMFSAMLWLLYGILRIDLVIVLPNLTGLLLGTWYVSTYHIHCNNSVYRKSLDDYYKICFFVIIGLIAILIFSTRSLGVYIVGLIAAFFNVISYGSPLAALQVVMRDKSTACMPAEVSIGNFLCSTLWLAYGFIETDLFIIVPNLLGTVVGSLQLILLAAFPPPKSRGFAKLIGKLELRNSTSSGVSKSYYSSHLAMADDEDVVVPEMKSGKNFGSSNCSISTREYSFINGVSDDGSFRNSNETSMMMNKPPSSSSSSSNNSSSSSSSSSSASGGGGYYYYYNSNNESSKNKPDNYYNNSNNISSNSNMTFSGISSNSCGSSINNNNNNNDNNIGYSIGRGSDIFFAQHGYGNPEMAAYGIGKSTEGHVDQ